MMPLTRDVGQDRAPSYGELVWWDARSFAVAVVIVTAFVSPNFTLRQGGLICGLIFVASLYRWRLSAADMTAIGFATLALLSSLWTAVPGLTSNSVFNLSAGCAVYLAVRVACLRRRDFRIIAMGFILGALASVWVIASDNNFNLRWSYDEGAERVGLEWLNVNYTAYSLVTASAVIVALVLFRKKGELTSGPVPGLSMVALLYLGVVMNGTRGALLSLVGLVIWFSVSKYFPRFAFKGLLGVFVIANAVILFGWADALLKPTSGGDLRDTGDLNGRLGVWPLARDVFHDNWLLGVGAGAFPGVPANGMGINAHAVVLDIAAGLGVAGLVLFFGTWAFAFSENFGTVDGRIGRALGAFLVVSLPIMLSGFWLESTVLWGGIALFSRVSVLVRENNLVYAESETTDFR